MNPQDLKNELQDNPRLRMLVALVLAILWLYGLFILRDRSTQLAREHAALANQLNTLVLEAGERTWLARADQVKKHQLALERGLWLNKTAGLAQAAWQDALILGLAKANAVRPSAVVTISSLATTSLNSDADPTSAKANRYQPLRARVEFDFNSTVLHQWLGDLAKAEPFTIVENLSIRREPSPKVEAQLLSILLLSDAPATSDSKIDASSVLKDRN